jgi:hypothetical protein
MQEKDLMCFWVSTFKWSALKKVLKNIPETGQDSALYVTGGNK